MASSTPSYIPAAPSTPYLTAAMSRPELKSRLEPTRSPSSKPLGDSINVPAADRLMLSRLPRRSVLPGDLTRDETNTILCELVSTTVSPLAEPTLLTYASDAKLSFEQQR